jgi:hypothetical protein
MYLKLVLTVIALALVSIALRLGPTPVTALGGGCGTYLQPCYVKVVP